jgi:Mg-chelatase subunit ChlD
MQMTDIAGSQIPTGGRIEFELFLQQLKKEGLDIAITFDSTGSMQGEIDQVKSQIERIGKILQRLIPSVRISICTYRDHGDEYVVRGLPLTDKLSEVVGFLSEVQAGGGGDEPEAVDKGLAWVVENNEFRDTARKVILLFGDAPPHYDKQTECLRIASDFRRNGGIISTVTCRKERQSVPLAEIAQLGGGESFLTSDDRQIVARLVVLVFGSRYEERVMELFELAPMDR